MMTPSSPRQSPSSETMSWSTRCLPASLYPVYPYRSPRPSTPPCPLPELPHLSCWWTEDLTDSWQPSPGITLPVFYTLFSSPSQRSSAKLTMAATGWWSRFQNSWQTGHSHLDPLIPIPLNPRGNPPPPTLSPLLTWPSILSPSWPDKLIPSPMLWSHPLPLTQREIPSRLYSSSTR